MSGQTLDASDPLARMLASRTRSAGTLIVLAVLALSPSLFAPFVADDYFHIEVAAKLGEALTRGWVLPIDTAGAWWTPPGLAVEYFRPLIVLSFAADRLLHGVHAAGYHLMNLALHGATTLLAWGIARRVLGAGFGAWAAAALFAVHPCHTQAVAWISGRTDVLASLLYLGALLLYLESRPLRMATAHWLALSLVLFALAMFAKEMAVTFPAALLAHALLWPRREPLGRRLVAPGLAGLLGALYFVVRMSVLGGFHPPPTPFAYHLGDPELIGHLAMAPLLYLGDLVLFLSPDPMVTVPYWRAHPLLLVLFAGIVLLTFSSTVRKTPNPVVLAWGLGWMVITLLPVAMLTMGEHFLYLPSMGYCILVGSQLPESPERVEASTRRALTIVGGLVLAVCVGRTVLFETLSRASSRVIDDAAAALDRDPSAKFLAVADLPSAAALAFPHAVRFARPGREVDLEILSISPHLTSGADEHSIVAFPAPDRLELRRDDGFIGSYIERALAGPRPPFRAGETVQRPGYTVSVVDAPGGRLHEFAVHLIDPSHTIVLRGGDHGLAPLTSGTQP